jgi:hypothetical protein
VKRREFITLLGSSFIARPLAAQAQQRVRRVAVLMATTPDEPESQARITALAQGLQEAGYPYAFAAFVAVLTGGEAAPLQLNIAGPEGRLERSAEIMTGLRTKQSTVSSLF